MKKTLDICIILMLTISILIYFYLIYLCANRYFLEGLIFFVPVIILIFLRYILSNPKIEDVAVAYLSIVIILVYIVSTFYGVAFLIVKDGSEEIRDVNEYSRLLHLQSNELIYYFPNKIPKIIEDVQFYYRPQFLQGGMKIVLEFKTTEDEINSYIDRYKNDYIDIIKASEYTERELNEFGIYNYLIDLNENMEDVTIYLIISEPGNHGRLGFITVNEEKTKISFQAERW